MGLVEAENMKTQMQLKKFFEGIHMMPEAAEQVFRLCISEKEYQEVREIFYQDRERFYETVLKNPDFRIRFLYYFSRLACETYAHYRKLKIEDAVFRDTFYDLTLWCQNCQAAYGEYGIDQYDWFFRHIECTLFRLGRLEFERAESEWELHGVREIERGETVIYVHIPQGEKLDICAVKDSFHKAYCFWGEQYAYLCHSWLLYPGLIEMMSPQSNIIRFQKLFQVADTEFKEREGEWRIYGCLKDEPREYPENTSLQKAAKQYLLAGNKLGNGIGIYIGGQADGAMAGWEG